MSENSQEQQTIPEDGGRRPVAPPRRIERSRRPAYAFYLIVVGILAVTVIFLTTMIFFGDAFRRDAAQLLAALTSVFTVIATLIGAYFGIKASGDARDAAEGTREQSAAMANAVLALSSPEIGAQAVCNAADGQ